MKLIEGFYWQYQDCSRDNKLITDSMILELLSFSYNYFTNYYVLIGSAGHNDRQRMQINQNHHPSCD